MLTQKGANTIKIISVAVGLLVSTLVFGRLDYNYNYDTCFPDRDNLYQIWMSYDINGEKLGPFNSCPGKLAECVMEALGNDVISAPAVGRHACPPLFLGDRRIDIPKLAVDSMFFKTMGLEVLIGNPSADMAVPDIIYLSESTARNIYGEENPIGKTLSLDRETTVIVKGVFKDLPKNVTIEPFKALLSQPTWRSYQRYQEWTGADNWLIYFRLKPDTGLKGEEIRRKLNLTYQSHVPDTDSYRSEVSCNPISRTYLQYESVKRINLVMWILGVSLLLMTTLNYALLTIASLSRRSKAIGIHKCSGAGNGTIMRMFLCETFIVLTSACVVMVIMIFVFEKLISDTLSLSLDDIFATSRLWIPFSVLTFFFLLGGLLPGQIFSKIPVTQVFRRFTERNSAWKRTLLFIQIGGVAFVGTLMTVVSAQYSEITGHDMGFSVERMAKINIPYQLDKEALKSTLKQLPYVEKLTASVSDPLWGYSGQHIYDDAGNVLFNTRFEWIDENFLDAMEIGIVAGRGIERDGEVVITEEFGRRMNLTPEDIGQLYSNKVFGVSLKLVGIAKDYQLGGFFEELRPICLIYGGFSGNSYLKIKEPFDQNFIKLVDFLSGTFPAYDFAPVKMPEEAIEIYSDVRMFRNSALIDSVALIFISLMGLIGFARNEVQRRSKEIAIRKVNGAEASDIVSLIIADVARIAIPAIILGVLCAAYIGHIWLSNFSVTASHIGLWYILAGLTVLILVTGCVIAVTYRIANENPVNRLKSE